MVLLTLGESMGILKYGFGNILPDYFMLSIIYLYKLIIIISLISYLFLYISIISLYLHINI